jgi:hypothetical protein
MAIGDAIAVYLGTAVTNRQPSSGVEEQIGMLANPAVTDAINTYDGTNAIAIVDAGYRTNEGNNSSQDAQQPVYNMCLLITNSVYLRKTGTTDRWAVSGVQTNI